MSVTLVEISSGHANNLTIIRLLAALAVIYGHAYAVLPGNGGDWVASTTGVAFAGGVAVDMFFLISGFLVTGSLLEGGVKHYFASRVLRIYPALWVHLILVTFFVGPLFSSLSIREYFRSADVLTYFNGLAGTYRGAFFLPGVFPNNPDHAVNGSIWSVLIEVWLYAFLLVAYVLGVFRHSFIFNSLFFIGMVAIWQDSSWLPIEIGTTTVLHVCLMFFIGVFIYINRKLITVNPLFLLLSLFLAGITINTDRFIYAYILLLISAFICIGFYRQFAAFARYGDFSYGIYLYGWPVQQVFVSFFPTMSPLQNAAISSVVAFLLGGLSWHFIEKPALGYKRFFPKARKAVVR